MLSVLNVKIGGSVESVFKVVVNRDYYSINNSLFVTTSFDYPDWFECKWTTLPKDNTTNFKRNYSIFNQHDQHDQHEKLILLILVCRDFEAKTANGTIQPMGTDTTTDRLCSISIVAPSDYQIEFACFSLDFNIELGVDFT